ncbi:MAG: hypothetical protein ACYTX0_48905 [Nostoc sp.]
MRNASLEEQTSHSYQPSYTRFRIYFKTVATRIALKRTDIARSSTIIHERSLDF